MDKVPQYLFSVGLSSVTACSHFQCRCINSLQRGCHYPSIHGLLTYLRTAELLLTLAQPVHMLQRRASFCQGPPLPITLPQPLFQCLQLLVVYYEGSSYSMRSQLESSLVEHCVSCNGMLHPLSFRWSILLCWSLGAWCSIKKSRPRMSVG